MTGFDIPRAKKGDAVPAAPEPRSEAPPSPAGPVAVTHPPAAPVPEAMMGEAAGGEPRSAVTTRLTLRTQERLRLLAFKTRRTKQAILDEALEAYLASKGV